VFPDIRAIEVHEREVDRHLYLATARRTTGPRLPAWLLSDGTLRFLALTLLAYLPPQDSIYLIEEPENGIHPRALEAVFQSLSSVYEGQILVATHSPLMLSLTQPEQLLCFTREHVTTEIVQGNHHPRLRDWRGESSLGVLFAAGVLG
jgi:predicted ATPase